MSKEATKEGRIRATNSGRGGLAFPSPVLTPMLQYIYDC